MRGYQNGSARWVLVQGAPGAPCGVAGVEHGRRASKRETRCLIKKINKNKRWTPVHRGGVYCSPACGCGCRYSEYVRVKELAAKLAKHLGPGWSPVVWENSGWHGEAQLETEVGLMQVSPIAAGGYWATLSGPRLEQIHGVWRTARRAVEGVREKAQDRIRCCIAVMDATKMPWMKIRGEPSRPTHLQTRALLDAGQELADSAVGNAENGPAFERSANALAGWAMRARTHLRKFEELVK